MQRVKTEEAKEDPLIIMLNNLVPNKEGSRQNKLLLFSDKIKIHQISLVQEIIQIISERLVKQ
jgi:hypothetical protein